jgi:hypothetical protein
VPMAAALEAELRTLLEMMVGGVWGALALWCVIRCVGLGAPHHRHPDIVTERQATRRGFIGRLHAEWPFDLPGQ